MAPASTLALEASDHVAALDGQAGLAVHLVDRITPAVLSFLLPTLCAIQAAGRPQALIYVDGRSTGWSAEQLPSGLQLHAVPDHVTPMGRLARLYARLGRLGRDTAVSTLHLHGVLPALVGLHWVRRRAHEDVKIYFSPHSSRALARQTPLRAGVTRLLQIGLAHRAARTIVNLEPEAEALGPLSEFPVMLIESPVPQVFFDTSRREAKRPLLISGNLDGQRAAVDAFARVAVLLNDDQLSISFNWIGHAEPDAASALKAAGIGQFAVATDDSRAQRMATAWIYVAPTKERGFPVRLAEAMAAGLPSVAIDTPAHRSLLEDGLTGYLCGDLRSLLQRIALLVDSSELRETMGAAARRVAIERFSDSVFRSRLLDTVGLPPPLHRPQAPGSPPSE